MSLSLEDAVTNAKTYADFWGLLINNKILSTVTSTFTERYLKFIKLIYSDVVPIELRLQTLNFLIDMVHIMNYKQPINLIQNRDALLYLPFEHREFLIPVENPLEIHAMLVKLFETKYLQKNGSHHKIMYSKHMVSDIFYEIDKHFLKGRLKEVMSVIYIKIDFQVTQKCKRLYGKFLFHDRPNPWIIQLTTCHRNIDEIIKTLEHEMCHLIMKVQSIINEWYTGEISIPYLAHGKDFEMLLGTLFGGENHLDYCMEAYKKKYPKEIGTLVEFNYKNTSLIGKIIKVNRKTINVQTDNKEIYNVKYKNAIPVIFNKLIK